MVVRRDVSLWWVVYILILYAPHTETITQYSTFLLMNRWITFRNMPYIIVMPGATRAQVLVNVLGYLPVTIRHNGANSNALLIQPFHCSNKSFFLH